MNISKKAKPGLRRVSTKASAPQAMYVFRVKGRAKGAMHIEVQVTDQETWEDFDGKLRRALGYDTWDHLSGFFEGTPWRSQQFATVYPFGGEGENSGQKIGDVGLTEGEKIGYVYDFGDNLQHMLVLTEILPIIDGKPIQLYARG